MSDPVVSAFIVAIGGASVGAFIGAFAAFLLENQRRIREEVREQVKHGNLALYSLFLVWDRLEQYARDNLRPP